MAYFNNPTNRASWEKAMTGLRAERERRLSGGEPGAVASARDFGSSFRASSAERIPVTFQQILDEYRIEQGGKPAPSPSVSMEARALERGSAIEEPALSHGSR